MRFRAVRPSQLGKVDAIIVPLFAGAEPPAWLSRPTRAAIARLLKEEQGVTRLYGVNTLHEEPRVVIVGAGKPGELDAERARNIASAGIRALWRSSVRKVGIAIAADSIGEERAAQAAVEAVLGLKRGGRRRLKGLAAKRVPRARPCRLLARVEGRHVGYEGERVSALGDPALGGETLDERVEAFGR